MADQVFILPIDEKSLNRDEKGGAARTRRIPKYTEAGGIRGHSGVTMEFPESEHQDVPWSGQEMFLVRVFGDGGAIQDIARQDDAYPVDGRTVPRPKFAEYLNELHGREQSYDEWIQEYTVS